MTSAYINPPDDAFPATDSIPASRTQDDQLAEEAIQLEEAVLYLRVSSKKQMDTDADYDPEGNSIPTQRRIAQGKADALGAPVAREFVEPGRTATSLEKRVAFQEMMTYLTTENRQRKKEGRPLIRYVIVYMMSRAFRNALEELQTKAQLAKMGITLVSAKENFGDGYLGDAMQGILAIFNELQVRMSGDDIKTKMANKARNGGTIARAPLGYLNTSKHVEGREVRTVIIDPERGPLVRLAFELYATGDYTIEDLLSFSLVVWCWRVDFQSGVGQEGPCELLVLADAVDAGLSGVG
ncbi:recombinase family protein, partial [Actinomadura sp. NBRC 104412]|uniref:recombinase family protein n=1 Tax=Actinomadura sp. NBRC 104412 TaxID=3032203 RepID=UPI002556C084